MKTTQSGEWVRQESDDDDGDGDDGDDGDGGDLKYEDDSIRGVG